MSERFQKLENGYYLDTTDQALYAKTRDGYFYAVLVGQGHLLKRTKTGEWFDEVDQTFYRITEEGHLHFDFSLAKRKKQQKETIEMKHSLEEWAKEQKEQYQQVLDEYREKDTPTILPLADSNEEKTRQQAYLKYQAVNEFLIALWEQKREDDSYYYVVIRKEEQKGRLTVEKIDSIQKTPLFSEDILLPSDIEEEILTHCVTDYAKRNPISLTSVIPGKDPKESIANVQFLSETNNLLTVHNIPLTLAQDLENIAQKTEPLLYNNETEQKAVSFEKAPVLSKQYNGFTASLLPLLLSGLAIGVGLIATLLLFQTKA